LRRLSRGIAAPADTSSTITSGTTQAGSAPPEPSSPLGPAVGVIDAESDGEAAWLDALEGLGRVSVALGVLVGFLVGFWVGVWSGASVWPPGLGVLTVTPPDGDRVVEGVADGAWDGLTVGVALGVGVRVGAGEAACAGAGTLGAVWLPLCQAKAT
jgi:hypothetical protein